MTDRISFNSSSFQIQSKRKLLSSIVVTFSMKIACPKDTISIIARCANLNKPSCLYSSPPPLSEFPFETEKNVTKRKIISFRAGKKFVVLQVCRRDIRCDIFYKISLILLYYVSLYYQLSNKESIDMYIHISSF